MIRNTDPIAILQKPGLADQRVDFAVPNSLPLERANMESRKKVVNGRRVLWSPNLLLPGQTRVESEGVRPMKTDEKTRLALCR